MEIQNKYERLKEYFRSAGSAAVAFSGGVDSTFLLKAAIDALGDKAAAVTVYSCFMPEKELDEAEEFCRSENIRHFICEVNPLLNEEIADNPPERCYLCKKEIFGKIKAVAAENDIRIVAEGSNLDDNSDYRPGLSAIRELGVKSPLQEVGFTKQEIRTMSDRLNLPTWNKPSFACLASRFAYGEKLSEEKLHRTERAELLMSELNFSQFRVRSHGDMARIEVLPEDFDKLIAQREEICDKFKEYGFIYVSMDLSGYRMGSMNETLKMKDL